MSVFRAINNGNHHHFMQLIQNCVIERFYAFKSYIVNYLLLQAGLKLLSSSVTLALRSYLIHLNTVILPLYLNLRSDVLCLLTAVTASAAHSWSILCAFPDSLIRIILYLIHKVGHGTITLIFHQTANLFDNRTGFSVTKSATVIHFGSAIKNSVCTAPLQTMTSGLKQCRHENSLHRNQDVVGGKKQFKIIYKSCQ